MLRGYDRLNLGCGPHRIHGWGNVDISGYPNMVWDLRKPLPVGPNTIRFIYSEHFIEHISRLEALRLLKNCKTALTRGGVIRISTPNLRYIAKEYLNGNLIEMPHGSWKPKTPCAMLNEAMHLWGHQFVYDEAELILLLEEAGFSQVRRMSWGQSEHVELRGLETRPYFDDLIVEAVG